MCRILLPGTLDLLILRTLAGGAKHGYGFVQSCSSRLATCFKLEKVASSQHCNGFF